MKKLFVFCLLLVFINLNTFSQEGILVLKRGHTTIRKYWKGETIAFMLENRQWMKGEIVKVYNDSFLLRPSFVEYYLYGRDTIHMAVLSYSIHDIYIMPKKGLAIDFKEKSFQPSPAGYSFGFYWLKSGYIFKLFGAMYGSLNLINSCIDNDLSFNNNLNPLSIAAGSVLTGFILHKIYSPFHKIGKRYHFETINL